MIEIAASLRFGIGASGNAWLRRGWSDPEEGFVWALGARSSLTLSLLPAPGRVFLELTLKPFVNPPRLTRRRLDIVVNGKLLAEKTLSEQATVRIEIPAEIRRQPGLLVEFRHPEAQTPAQLGLGDDQRALAIQLHAVTILLTGSRDELVKPAGPSSVLAAYRFGGNETTDAMLLEGWGEPEVDYVWSVGRRSILRLPISREKQAHTLVLDMLPFTQRDAVPRQRIAVGADDQLLGFISMHQRSAFAFALPPPKGRANAVVLSFDNLDGTPRETGLYKDGRPFVFMLLRLRVLRHPRPMERAESPLRNISLPGNLYDGSLQRSVLAATGFAANEVANVFESLGSNCEMSLLQRRLGREPNGLLRYSGIMTHGLVEGILEGFWGLGRPETMEVIIRDDPLRSYMVVDHPYALSFQTPVSSRAVSVDMLKRRLAGNQPLLVRKFFEDLSEGRKIFVFQRRDPTTRPEADAVLAALSVWGECTLLWVVQDAALAGGVKRLGPRLMQGFVDYSGTAMAGSDESWLRMLTNAWLEKEAVLF